MDIKTKYKVGDHVYIIDKNKISKKRIHRIEINIDYNYFGSQESRYTTSIKYHFTDNRDIKWDYGLEEDVYDNWEEMMKDFEKRYK